MAEGMMGAMRHCDDGGDRAKKNCVLTTWPYETLKLKQYKWMASKLIKENAAWWRRRWESLERKQRVFFCRCIRGPPDQVCKRDGQQSIINDNMMSVSAARVFCVPPPSPSRHCSFPHKVVNKLVELLLLTIKPWNDRNDKIITIVFIFHLAVTLTATCFYPFRWASIFCSRNPQTRGEWRIFVIFIISMGFLLLSPNAFCREIVPST